MAPSTLKSALLHNHTVDGVSSPPKTRARTPTPSPVMVSTDLSAASRLIISAIKSKPIAEKPDILPLTNNKKSFPTKSSGAKVPPKKKGTTIKIPQEKKGVVVGGTGPPKSILSSSFFNYLNLATFSGQTKESTKEEMLAYDHTFSK